MATPTSAEFIAADPTTLVALWGAAEWFAFVGLLVTLAGLYVAFRSIRSTEQAAREATNSAPELLQHEQSADLQIPYAPGDYAHEIPDGALLWITRPEINYDVALVRGRLRNVGRYGAKDVVLHVHQAGTPLRVRTAPPPYIEENSVAYRFEFELPFDVPGAPLTVPTLDDIPGVLPGDEPIEIRIEYADGNDREPNAGSVRLWKFRFAGDRPWGNWKAEQVGKPETFKRDLLQA